MTSLVIGASGLVGWQVAHALRSLGPVSGTALAHRSGQLAPLDVRDASAVRRHVAELAPDVVVCAAADPNVEACERDPAATRAVNVVGFANVAEAAREAGARLVTFSSDYVFGGDAGRLYREDDPVSPINEYGRQKVELERIASDVPGSLVCRISGVFGWELGRPDCRNFVCRIVQRLRRGESVVAANDQALCPTAAVDVAAAVRALIARRGSGVVHVAGPRVLTRDAFARSVARAFGLPEDLVQGVPTGDLALAAKRPAASGLAIDRLRELVGEVPRDVEHALAEMARDEPARATRAAGPGSAG